MNRLINTDAEVPGADFNGGAKIHVPRLARLKDLHLAYSSNKTKYDKYGIYFEYRPEDQEVTIVATNGVWMAKVDLEAPHSKGDAFSTVIPGRAFQRAVDELAATDASAWIFVKDGRACIMSYLDQDLFAKWETSPVDDTFPDWRKALEYPEETVPTEKITVDAVYMRDMLRLYTSVFDQSEYGFRQTPCKMQLFGPDEGIRIHNEDPLSGIRMTTILMPMDFSEEDE